MKTFTFHNDPGHGWLEVTQPDLDDLLLTYVDFSAYSYTDGQRLYLEEDCDAGIFLNAYAAKYGRDSFRITETHTNRDSFIRALRRNPVGG